MFTGPTFTADQQQALPLGSPETSSADPMQQINLQQLNQNILLSVQAINNLNKQLATWFT